MKITKDTILGELLEQYPKAEEVLREYLGDAPCLTCPGKMYDTIGNGALIHGLPEAEVDAMVADIQTMIEQKKLEK